MFSCRRASTLQAEAISRKLTKRERISLFGHSLICSTCRRLGRELERLSNILEANSKRLDEAVRAATPGLNESQRDRIRTALRAATDATPLGDA
ncbi:MAG: hypothetical protein ACR2GY_10530 [Phycisphaerales bacterium]